MPIKSDPSKVHARAMLRIGIQLQPERTTQVHEHWLEKLRISLAHLAQASDGHTHWSTSHSVVSPEDVAMRSLTSDGPITPSDAVEVSAIGRAFSRRFRVHSRCRSQDTQRSARGIAQCNAGAAAIEFGLVVPILLILFMGLLELGMAFLSQVQVETAAQAGIARAELDGFDIPSIQNAVTTSTRLTAIEALPAPTLSCGCLSGATIVSADCSSICVSGKKAGTYVTVHASTTYSPLMRLIYSSPFTITSTAVTRIR